MPGWDIPNQPAGIYIVAGWDIHSGRLGYTSSGGWDTHRWPAGNIWIAPAAQNTCHPARTLHWAAVNCTCKESKQMGDVSVVSPSLPEPPKSPRGPKLRWFGKASTRAVTLRGSERFATPGTPGAFRRVSEPPQPRQVFLMLNRCTPAMTSSFTTRRFQFVCILILRWNRCPENFRVPVSDVELSK